GRLADGVFGNELAIAIDVAGERVDAGFEDIADDSERADHVSVEGAVARGHFALVAGGEDERAELVGDSHQESGADARLEVFLREAERGSGEERSERCLILREDVVDGDLFKADAEVFGERASVIDGAGGREFAGHAEAEDVLMAEGFNSDGGDEG